MNEVVTACGVPAGVTDPLGHSYTLTLDSHGNPVTVTDPLSHQTTLTYDAQGKPLTVTDPANDTAHFSYYLGDLSAVSDPLGNSTNLFTDDAGRLASITDPAGQITSLAYDALSRLTTMTDANGGVTSFSYDADSNLLSVTDARKGVTSYFYNSLNQLVQRSDPLNNYETYSNDAGGNVTQYTDRRGKVANFTYDGINRRTFAGFGYNSSNGTYESTINYTWDGGDRLTQAVDSIAGTITRAYDGLDRVTSETTPQGSISYGYDNAGRRTSMTVAGQTAVNYAWDNANRLTGMTQGSSSVALNYDAANRRTSLTLPNSVAVAYTYDSDAHVTGITYNMGSTQLGSLGYRFDVDGRIVERSGSLAGTNIPAAVGSTAYNADNELTNWGGLPLTYDANGNNTQGINGNQYTWDGRNHMTAIASSPAASFVYDAFGRRVKKTISGTTTQYLYDGLNPVQELNSNNVATANLMTGLNIDEFFGRTDSSGARSFLTDILRSTLALTDSSGTIQTQYTYEPFGNVTVSGAANGNSYQFTGRDNDGTGLYFYRARYYSPGLQRFISQDPIGFAGGDADLYGYVGNDPVRHRDETGKGFWTGIAVGAACAAYIGYSYYSNLAELNKLGQEKEQLGQEINNLRQQQNSCNDAEKQAQLEEQIEPLEQQFQNLAGQYAAAHAADSFSEEAKIAACVLATRLAFLSLP